MRQQRLGACANDSLLRTRRRQLRQGALQLAHRGRGSAFQPSISDCRTIVEADCIFEAADSTTTIPCAGILGDKGAAMLNEFAALVALASWLFNSAAEQAARPQAAGGETPPIVYSHGNGGPGFSSHEQVTLKPDGTVVFETSGPVAFDWTTQNRV